LQHYIHTNTKTIALHTHDVKAGHAGHEPEKKAISFNQSLAASFKIDPVTLTQTDTQTDTDTVTGNDTITDTVTGNDTITDSSVKSADLHL